MYRERAVEYDDCCFEEMLRESLGNFGAVHAEGVGSTATNALWTFGVAPTHFHPRTRILKAAYRVRRQSFVAIKRAGGEKGRASREGWKMEHTCARERRAELSKAFRLPANAKHDCQHRKNYRCELSMIRENPAYSISLSLSLSLVLRLLAILQTQ